MKTNDPLENFIESNREAFDSNEVPAESWDYINRKLGIRKKVSLWNNVAIWRAAAVLFMAVSIYFIVPSFKGSSTANTASIKEFNDVESFYSGEISRKVALIDELSNGESDDFTQDFKQLEAMYQVLKEELKNHPSKKVKDALVLNLIVRINLLNQQLQKLEESDKSSESGGKSAT
jgi:hypothetical protein